MSLAPAFKPGTKRPNGICLLLYRRLVPSGTTETTECGVVVPPTHTMTPSIRPAPRLLAVAPCLRLSLSAVTPPSPGSTAANSPTPSDPPPPASPPADAPPAAPAPPPSPATPPPSPRTTRPPDRPPRTLPAPPGPTSRAPASATWAARCTGSSASASSDCECFAAAAMIADCRINPRASSGTSSNLSDASIIRAIGSIHSGGFSQRSRRSFNSLAAKPTRPYAGQ